MFSGERKSCSLSGKVCLFLWLVNFSSSLGLSAVLASLLQLLGLLHFFPWSSEKCLCKCSALNKWIILFDVGEITAWVCMRVYAGLLNGSPAERSQLGRCVRCQPHIHLSVPKRSLPTDLHCCGLEPPRHRSPCDSQILSPIPKPIWIKLYPTSQKDTTVNFNLTQVPISLLVTALPACLSAMTEPHSLSMLQFPSGCFGSSLLLFTKRRV